MVVINHVSIMRVVERQGALRGAQEDRFRRRSGNSVAIAYLIRDVMRVAAGIDHDKIGVAKQSQDFPDCFAGGLKFIAPPDDVPRFLKNLSHDDVSLVAPWITGEFHRDEGDLFVLFTHVPFLS